MNKKEKNKHGDNKKIADLSLYSEKDLDDFKKYLPALDEKQEELKLKYLEPTIIEIQQVNKIIIDYIKKHKRKVYGGFALNRLIKIKNSKDAFYKNEDTQDIEFYSNTPLIDLKELANTLFDNNFKEVQGVEATHSETYTIIVNFRKYCDISYVPTIIYGNIPTRNIDGIELVDPSFMLIDYLRQINDPRTSFWRIEKTFKRLFLLQKYYPLKRLDKPTSFPEKTNPNSQYLNEIYNFLKNNTKTVLFGYYAYNYYITGNPPATSDIPYFEVISIDYINDGYKLLNKIKELKDKNEKDTIKVDEYYPFFQFHGRKMVIYINNNPIIYFYSNQHMCVPFIDIELNKTSKDFLRISTFTYTTMMSLILYQEYRTYKNIDRMKNQQYMLTNLYDTRNIFFQNDKKSITEKTRFEEFQLDCVGETEEQPRLYRKKLMKRKAKNLPLVQRYKPSEGKDKEFTFQFPNTSGNIINNEKNRKIKLQYTIQS